MRTSLLSPSRHLYLHQHPSQHLHQTLRLQQSLRLHPSLHLYLRLTLMLTLMQVDHTVHLIVWRRLPYRVMTIDQSRAQEREGVRTVKGVL